MKSIKEKAEKHLNSVYAGYDDVIKVLVKESYEHGANYVLKHIIETIRICDNDRNTDLYKSLWGCIDELRK